MKKKETTKNTTDSRVYKILFRLWLNRNSRLCPICDLHSGCNFWNKGKTPQRNWKNYRKSQYKS